MASSTPRYAFCKQMADKVLNRHRVASPPVPILEIAAQEGYEVIYCDWPKGRDGLLDVANGRIGLNRNCPVTRLQFTVAHELGHALLGHHAVRDEPPHLDNPPLGESDTYPMHLEREANAFAGALLIPESLLRKAVRTHRTPKELARAFDVSEQAMWVQLEATKLIKAIV